jgi:hypothetical protein
MTEHEERLMADTQAIAARLTAIWDQVARAEDEALGDHLSFGTFSHLMNPFLYQQESDKAWLRAQRDVAEEKLTEEAATRKKWSPLTEAEQAELDNLLAQVILPTFTEREREIATLVARFLLAHVETLEREKAELEQQRDAALAALTSLVQAVKRVAHVHGWSDELGSWSGKVLPTEAALAQATTAADAALAASAPPEGK